MGAGRRDCYANGGAWREPNPHAAVFNLLAQFCHRLKRVDISTRWVCLAQSSGMINRAQFTDSYQPDFGMPYVPPLPPKRLPGMDANQKVMEEMTVEQLLAYESWRKEINNRAEANPVGAGWTLPMWRLVMENWKKYSIIVILGGIRSTKTTLASRLALWSAGSIPGAEVRAYHVNDERSVEQQNAIYDALPIGLKNLPTKKGMFHSLQYSQKNGFTDNVMILPPLPGARRGGTIKFGNYSQYKQDPQVTEGFKSHLIWCDEEVPAKMFETLIYRTTDYHGRIILTFTTLQGWSSLVQDILGKTRTLKSAFAPLVGRQVPVMQESLSRPGAVIYYFHTADNVFIDTADFVDKVKGRPREEILARAYGIPTKAIASVFPAFNKEVNVVKHEDLPFIKNPDYPVTRYMALDPGGSKNWFMLWVAIDAAETWWVYAEWPDYDDWAVSGNNAEGKPGPAQRGSKKGLKDYIELIKSIEGEKPVYERIIDPRLAAAQRQSEDGATTLLGDLDKFGMTFIPAPGGGGVGTGEIEDGLQLINDLLAWDEAKKRDSVNTPHLFISDRCHNMIFAMQEYTAKGGKDEATKDPIDCLRYLRKASCMFLEEVKPDRTRTGCY